MAGTVRPEPTHRQGGTARRRSTVRNYALISKGFAFFFVVKAPSSTRGNLHADMDECATLTVLQDRPFLPTIRQSIYTSPVLGNVAVQLKTINNIGNTTAPSVSTSTSRLAPRTSERAPSRRSWRTGADLLSTSTSCLSFSTALRSGPAPMPACAQTLSGSPVPAPDEGRQETRRRGRAQHCAASHKRGSMGELGKIGPRPHRLTAI